MRHDEVILHSAMHGKTERHMIITMLCTELNHLEIFWRLESKKISEMVVGSIQYDEVWHVTHAG